MVKSFKVPHVGGMDPRVIIGVGALGAGYVGWRWYQNRGDAGTATAAVTDPTATSDFADGGTVPGVLGAVPADNSFGDSSTGAGDTTQTGNGLPTTNAEWSQQALTTLQASDTWSFGDIVTALGNFLAGQPLSTLQQQIVQAALAVAGPVPVGSHPVISGGNTAVTVAPSISSIHTTDSTATIVFSPVAGAIGYRAYDNVSATNVGSSEGPSITVGGLRPNTTYSFHVAALSSSGALGPSSATVKAKTAAIVLTRPATPKVSAIAATSAHVATSVVKGAEGYNWYVNGVAHGHSDAPAYTIAGLHSKTSYKVTCSADTSTGSPGPASPAASFKTK